MKLKLIMPCASKLTKSNSSRVRLPPFGLTVIASLTPDEFEITLEDENVDGINFDEEVNLVGISSFSSNIERGYEIAEIYRKKGIPVVIGGFHASALPDEALQHADAVVIGEAETVWQKVLEDFKQGKMKGKYQGESFHDLKKLPNPRLDLIKQPNKYLTWQIVQTTRGCPFKCDFCTTSRFWGHKYRLRPIDEIVEEIRIISESKKHGAPGMFFADDDIAAVPKRAKMLFEKLIPLKIKWAAQAGVSIAKDEELLKLAKKSGCRSLFIGFETPNVNSLQNMNKRQNLQVEYKDIVKKLQKYGIIIQAAFIIGFDEDTPETFQAIKTFIKESGTNCFQLNVLYPYPGTRLRERFDSENRITSDDWSNYMLDGINYIPKTMTQDELHTGYVKFLKQHTTYRFILKKSLRTLFSMGVLQGFITAALNIGTRRSYKQILNNVNPIRYPSKNV